MIFSVPRGYAKPSLFRKQFIEDQDQIFKLQRRHSSEMHCSQKPLAHQSFGYFMDELKVTEGIELSYLSIVITSATLTTLSFPPSRSTRFPIDRVQLFVGSSQHQHHI